MSDADTNDDTDPDVDAEPEADEEDPVQWLPGSDADERPDDGEAVTDADAAPESVSDSVAEPDPTRPRDDDDAEVTGEPMTTPSVDEPLRVSPDDEITDNTIGWPLQFDQPNISRDRFPTWKLRKQLKKRQKLLDEGYVEWYLIDDAFPRPTYVKPTNRDGVPEVRHDGERYLFPRAAALPNKATGMWTFVHRRGFSDPLNLRDADEHAIPADVLDEYLSMSVSSSPPSLFDKFDIDGQTLLYAGIALVLVFGAAYQFMGGA